MRTNFHKCASFAGILRAGQRHRLSCAPEGIVAEKVVHFLLKYETNKSVYYNIIKCWQVYIRDDRREGSLSLCEVEVITHSGKNRTLLDYMRCKMNVFDM